MLYRFSPFAYTIFQFSCFHALNKYMESEHVVTQLL